jgi:hypothetical protein
VSAAVSLEVREIPLLAGGACLARLGSGAAPLGPLGLGGLLAGAGDGGLLPRGGLLRSAEFLLEEPREVLGAGAWRLFFTSWRDGGASAEAERTCWEAGIPAHHGQ